MDAISSSSVQILLIGLGVVTACASSKLKDAQETAAESQIVVITFSAIRRLSLRFMYTRKSSKAFSIASD